MPSFIFEKNTHDAISLVSSLCKAEHVCTLAMGGIPISTYIHTTPFDHSSQKALFIGPEGGWSADEISLFRESGLQDVSLTKTTLRAETAAIASLSYLFLC